nr:hypothetical protein CFP56_13191 [Quercus suber]
MIASYRLESNHASCVQHLAGLEIRETRSSGRRRHTEQVLGTEPHVTGNTNSRGEVVRRSCSLGGGVLADVRRNTQGSLSEAIAVVHRSRAHECTGPPFASPIQASDNFNLLLWFYNLLGSCA